MNPVDRVHMLVDLDLAKKMFLVLSAALLLWIPIDGISIYLGGVRTVRSRPVKREEPVKKAESREFYLSNFDRSALFGAAAMGTGAASLQASLAELTKDYRLQGVILTDEPEAIIQDARTQKTIFVKKGGQLGDLTVKEIKEGTAVLGYLGQEIKLEIQQAT